MAGSSWSADQARVASEVRETRELLNSPCARHSNACPRPGLVNEHASIDSPDRSHHGTRLARLQQSVTRVATCSLACRQPCTSRAGATTFVVYNLLRSCGSMSEEELEARMDELAGKISAQGGKVKGLKDEVKGLKKNKVRPRLWF